MPKTLLQKFKVADVSSGLEYEKELTAALSAESSLQNLVENRIAAGVGIGTDSAFNANDIRHYHVVAYVSSLKADRAKIPARIKLKTPTLGEVVLVVETKSLEDLQLLGQGRTRPGRRRS